MSTLFNKGLFKPIDGTFITEGMLALDSLAKVQAKYKKGDMDNFLNELHDSIGKYNNGKAIFLESKVASFSAGSWSATFNDTTLEKAEAFKSDKVWLALSVWTSACDLLFICYGQNPKIGDFLEEKVKYFKAGNTVRSTQSISFSKLITDYGFRVLSTSKSPADLRKIIGLKSVQLAKHLTANKIDTLQTFKEPYF